jgi:hypothetical protein
MNGGKISGNTDSMDGGGVQISGMGDTPTFTMTGGEISYNTAGSSNISFGGGGVSVGQAEFTMTGGKIIGNTVLASSPNTPNNGGGGLRVNSTRGKFTMTGGEISGNTADNGANVFVNTGTFLITAGTGAVIDGSTDYNESATTYPIIIKWNKPSTGPLAYTENTTTDLTVEPAGATAVWAIADSKLGISYANGTNTGFFDIDAMTFVSVLPSNKYSLRNQSAAAQWMSVSGRTLNLRLSDRGKVNIFTLNGKMVSTLDIGAGAHTLHLNNLPRGMYMVRANSGAWKQSVRMMVK